jgi:autotransporter-associated beta strand protein
MMFLEKIGEIGQCRQRRFRTRGIRCIPLTLALALCLLILPRAGWSDSATWSGAAGFDYNTLTNWAGFPASIPGANPSETATFTDTGAGSVGIGAATAYPVGWIFSNTPEHDYTITVAGGVRQGLTGITTTGKGIVTSIGAAGGAGTYSITGPSIFNISDNEDPFKSTTFATVITDGDGAGILDKTGDGLITLSGANTYSGGTMLNAGTLGIGIDSAVSEGQVVSGALGTGILTVASGNIQASGGYYTLANDIVIHKTLNASGAFNLTLNGSISGTGALSEYIC